MRQTTEGHEYSKVSIKSSAGPIRLRGLSKVAYSDGLEPGVVRDGDTPAIVGMTRGEYTAEASMDFATRRDYQDFVSQLGEGCYEQYFTLTHVYSERRITPIIKDVIPLCRIKKPSIDASGTDAVGVSVELAVAGVIEWNGIKPIWTED